MSASLSRSLWCGLPRPPVPSVPLAVIVLVGVVAVMEVEVVVVVVAVLLVLVGRFSSSCSPFFSFCASQLSDGAEQAQTPPPPPLLGARSVARSPKATQKGEATSGKKSQGKAEQTYFPTLVDIIEEKTYCSNGFWYVVVCYALNFSI